MRLGQLLVILLLVIVVLVGGYLLFKNNATSSPPPQVQYQCANGQYQSTPCPSPTAPSGGVTQPPQPAPTTAGGSGSSGGGTGGPSIVTTANQPCPTHDFSLQQGVATCNFPGGKTLICEGDLNDSLGTQYDHDATTGQVDILDQAATIDGTANGGSCHYSPPWTEQQSINSIKGGCGGGCTSVQVYHDGKLEKTV